jgi:hypothetical protein
MPERRLLVVIRTRDGDLVLQKNHDHQPRHHYDTEARTLLQSLFAPKQKKFCAKSKADDAFHQVLKFKRTSDSYAKGHFERKGIEWHPVLVDVAYVFNKDFIISRAKSFGGLKTRTLIPLEEHEYAEKLLKLFPRN